MKALFQSLLLRWFNRDTRQTGFRTLYLEADLIESLQDLAEQEQRPEEEVASELLSFALMQRCLADENLRRWRELSPREQEVAALATLGYTNREIGERLYISHETVKTHLQSIRRKYGLSRKHELRQALAQWDFSSWDRAPQSKKKNL